MVIIRKKIIIKNIIRLPYQTDEKCKNTNQGQLITNGPRLTPMPFTKIAGLILTLAIVTDFSLKCPSSTKNAHPNHSEPIPSVP